MRNLMRVFVAVLLLPNLVFSCELKTKNNKKFIQDSIVVSKVDTNKFYWFDKKRIDFNNDGSLDLILLYSPKYLYQETEVYQKIEFLVNKRGIYNSLIIANSIIFAPEVFIEMVDGVLLIKQRTKDDRVYELSFIFDKRKNNWYLIKYITYDEDTVLEKGKVITKKSIIQEKFYKNRIKITDLELP